MAQCLIDNKKDVDWNGEDTYMARVELETKKKEYMPYGSRQWVDLSKDVAEIVHALYHKCSPKPKQKQEH